MSAVNLLLVVPPECEQYLDLSARIRKVSRTQLCRRAMELVLRDRLFLSVLDDDDKPGTRTAPVRRSRGASARMSRDRLFDSLSETHSTPTRVIGPQFKSVNADNRTRAEMEADLRQAVLNTGGSL